MLIRWLIIGQRKHTAHIIIILGVLGLNVVSGNRCVRSTRLSHGQAWTLGLVHRHLRSQPTLHPAKLIEHLNQVNIQCFALLL